jgi:hypothetical protein
MASEPEEYIAVLKAAYDYEPQTDAEDEIAIKENQLLFLVERTDEEYVVSYQHPHPPARPTYSHLSCGQLVEGQNQGGHAG